jgi:hypothetical protein
MEVATDESQAETVPINIQKSGPALNTKIPNNTTKSLIYSEP